MTCSGHLIARHADREAMGNSAFVSSVVADQIIEPSAALYASGAAGRRLCAMESGWYRHRSLTVGPAVEGSAPRLAAPPGL
jgi:hypothetical protein